MAIHRKFSITPFPALIFVASYAGMADLLTSSASGDVLTVGVYDEAATDENTGTDGIQNNAVDVSATSDVGTQVAHTTFTSEVQTAFTQNRGGVINFDNGLGALFGNTFTATYGTSQTNSITISNGMANNWTAITSTSRTGISHPANGTKGVVLSIDGNTGTGDSPDFAFNFPATGRKVVKVGATLLSRTSAQTAPVVAEVTFSDATVASVNFNSAGNNSDAINDTFVGFEAPAGLYITRFKFDLPANEFRSVDDLAFITDVVETPQISYLNIAKAYADRMLLSGRDTYGPQNSPLFASVLNRTTGALLTSLPNMANIRNFDRDPGGSNVFHDQQLYQLLYDLPRFTGQATYSQAADQALTFFYIQTQSPATGLLAWGEHICWDFNTEVPINRLDNPHGEDQHEFFEEWQLAAKSYQLAPAAAQGFAQGLWDHQIFNQTTGTFSRHARYSSHEPESGQEFPRHGGYYILTWAEAYDRSTDASQRATRLQSIDVLATSFLNRRHAVTRAIPAGTGIDEYGKDYRNLHWLTNTIEMARTITRAADLVPAAQSTKLLELATSIDDVFLSLPHLNGGLGFVADTNVDNLSVITGRTSTWASGYGLATDAGIALACLDRYDRTNRMAYRTLGLSAADRYLTSQPPSNIEVHPGTFAEAITLMLDAHELTGNLAYRNRAEFFGTMAASTFFDGTSGLPRASSVHGHYETITGGDDLGYVLLRLHEAISPPLPPLTLAVSSQSDGRAELTWTDPSQYEAGFKIERRQGAGAYVELASVPGEDAVAMTDSGLSPGTTYTYRMRAFNPAGHSPYSNEVTLTTYTPIENWRVHYFNSPADQGTGADTCDADHDGMANLLEYAFATHPMESGPSPVVSDPSGEHLRIAFPRHVGRTDLTYRVRASNEMDGWTTIASSTGGGVMTASGALSVIESGSGELKNVLVVDSAVVGSAPKRFLRVEVTR